jgi:hypothetical protein
MIHAYILAGARAFPNAEKLNASLDFGVTVLRRTFT